MELKFFFLFFRFFVVEIYKSIYTHGSGLLPLCTDPTLCHDNSKHLYTLIIKLISL